MNSTQSSHLVLFLSKLKVFTVYTQPTITFAHNSIIIIVKFLINYHIVKFRLDICTGIKEQHHMRNFEKH